jgi:undecaprenyl-diphosphatase
VSEHNTALPRILRRPAAAAVTLGALGFVILAARYAGGSKAGWFDGRIARVVYALTPDPSRLSAMVVLGNPLPVAAAAVALGGVSLMLGRRRLAALAVIGPGLTGVATEIFKPLIGRTIEGGGFIYPSGHTGAATALGLVAALLLVNVWRPGPRVGAILLAAGALLTGGGMAVAVVVGGFHYPTDAAGGFCTAVAVVLGTALLLDRWADGRSKTA